MDVRQGLERELTPLCRELQLESDGHHPHELHEYAVDFDRWFRAAAHPNLVSDVFILQISPLQQANLFKLNSSRAGFEASKWPENLGQLHEYLAAIAPPFPSDAGSRGRPSNDVFPQDKPDNLDSDRSHPRGEMKAMRQFDPGPGAPPPLQGPGNSISPDGSAGFPWMIDEDAPALVHLARGVLGPDSEGRMHTGLAWVLVVLNRDVLGQEIMPELVQRYFGRTDQSSYEIAVTGSGEQQSDLYRSNPAFGSQQISESDAGLNLFGRPIPIVSGQSISARVVVPSDSRLQLSSPSQPTAVGAVLVSHDEGPFHIDPVRNAQGKRGWEILAKHREGSVEVAVAALFRRNLMFNFAVLAVLAATMTMIITTSQRARRLAQLQMDFVANVSHELRTPLTGIVSAAQNIADGVVGDKERVSRYGRAIIGQAGQLTELVEQILLFSATQKERYTYHFQLIDVADVVEMSLKSAAGLIRSAGVTVYREVHADLPKVSADLKALSQCLQNLIGNAVKYGGDARWIGIRAFAANQENGKKAVIISVSDRGIGISRKDLDHVFEPFYRSPSVTGAQIHGTGLGLPLARSVAEAMGGQITVQSEYGKGSTFMLQLPAAQ